jgi:hypothetical protein
VIEEDITDEDKLPSMSMTNTIISWNFFTCLGLSGGSSSMIVLRVLQSLIPDTHPSDGRKGGSLGGYFTPLCPSRCS